jgi:5'-nucleotidase
VPFTGAAGAVTVNGLKENGTLTLSGDTGGVSLGSSSVDGAVYVQDNAGPAVTVAGNTVTGPLYCTGNNPAPGDNGTVNTVSGTATSRCAAIAQR